MGSSGNRTTCIQSPSKQHGTNLKQHGSVMAGHGSNNNNNKSCVMKMREQEDTSNPAHNESSDDRHSVSHSFPFYLQVDLDEQDIEMLMANENFEERIDQSAVGT